MLDLDVLAVADDGAVLVAVGAVQAGGKVAGAAGAVVDKVKEGRVVGAVHIDAVVGNVRADILGVGVHGMLQRQRAVVVGRTGPVDAAVVAETMRAVVVVEVAVAVVDGILLHDDGLALMDIQRLPGQNQAEELVAAGAHGPDLADVLIVGVHGHETGDAALDLDLKQDVGFGQAALRAGRHDVVDHDGGDALVFIVGVARLTGQDVGLVGGQRRFRGSGRFRRGGGGGLLLGLFAGRQHHAQRKDRQDEQQLTFHSQFLFS